MKMRLKQVTVKKILMCLFDLVAVNLSFLITVYFCYRNAESFVFGNISSILVERAFFVSFVFLLVYWAMGLYSSLWEYAGLYELIKVAGATVIGVVLSAAVDIILVFMSSKGILHYSMEDIGNTFDISVYIYAAMMIIGFTGGMRASYRFFRRTIKDGIIPVLQGSKYSRVMIVGAGDMGGIIIKELEAKGYKKGKPVLAVDDDMAKQGQRIRGVRIKGGCDRIPELARQYSIDEIILCIPSTNSARQTELFTLAMETGCKVKTSPSILDMESGDVSLKKIREVDICDLLSRPEVRLDTEICSYLKGQTVLVTGGGGSIGSEICRQIMHYRPEKIVLFDIYENNAYTVKNQLDSNYEEKVETFIRIGTIREESRLEEVFEEFHPSIVFHAAAHKHVPLMEESPCEAIKNNIFGTYNVCNVASRYGVRKFVSLSTDKAVNPANVMGATKRVTELIVQYFDRKTSKDMQFAAVRFGNVLGSNGSVIPLFKEQLRNGGPVSVTDPKITRYFMTIPEAAQLVVQAGGLSEGGEIFVLDMGEPVKILALAENLIRLSGYRPYAEIDIIFTGLRPGEKLYEELSLKEEDASHHKTANDKIFVAKPLDFDDGFLEQCLDELRGATASQARDVLKKLVPNFIQSPDFRTIEEPIITQIGAD